MTAPVSGGPAARPWTLPGADLVGLLVRLKLTMLRHALGRSVWRTVGLVLGLLYALGAVGMAVVGLVALRFTSVAVTADVTVLGFAALTLGWLVFPTLVFGVDGTVDPARFALLPVRARDLLPGLLAAAAVGVPGLATAVLALAQVVTWTRGVGTVVAAVMAAVLGLATCLLLARAGTAVLARTLSSRRFRDAALVLVVALASGVGLVGAAVGSLGELGPARLLALLDRAAAVAAWTPFGWAWALPGDVGQGAWGVAGVRLVLAMGLVAGLWAVWVRALDRRLTEPLEVGETSRSVRSGWVDRFYPGTPTGGVAARTLRYWRRDPRYLSAVASYLVVPVVVISVSRLGPEPGSAGIIAFVPVLLALMLGASQAQDLSYDGSAVWLHAAIGVSGAADRAGRALSSLTIFLPLLLALCVVCTAAGGEWGLLLPSVAATLGVVLIATGVGAWVGTLWQWPAPPAGSNPFTTGNAGGLPALLSFTVASSVAAVVALPVLALSVAAWWRPGLGWLAFVVGLVSGAGALVAGVVLGGRRLDRRWPEVLTAVGEKRG